MQFLSAITIALATLAVATPTSRSQSQNPGNVFEKRENAVHNCQGNGMPLLVQSEYAKAYRKLQGLTGTLTAQPSNCANGAKTATVVACWGTTGIGLCNTGTTALTLAVESMVDSLSGLYADCNGGAKPCEDDLTNTERALQYWLSGYNLLAQGGYNCPVDDGPLDARTDPVFLKISTSTA